MRGRTEILLVHKTAAIFTQLGTHVSSCAASLHVHMPQNKTVAWNISPVESHNFKKQQNADSIEGDRSDHLRRSHTSEETGDKAQNPPAWRLLL